MRLEPDDAVDNVDPDFFERSGPPDVGLFVKTRLEFDDGGHLFAVFCRPDQRSDDRTVTRRTVEGLLDPEHRRIFSCLRDERLDRGGKGVMG